uniref:Uncharacterized protein n=1 Tax=viral metagenome TaxID=1070528 RepID=A0A6C0F6L5_9ZZZZ
MFNWIRILYATAILSPIKNSFIKNSELPVCKDCLHFKPYDVNEFSYNLGRCDKFGRKDIVSGEITYVFAELCRIDEDQCGKNGTYFESKNNNITATKKGALIEENYGW